MERWRVVKGYTDYLISDRGRLASLKYGKWKELRPSKCGGDKRPTAILYNNGKQKNKYIHQLVAEAFLGHVVCGMAFVVNHINGDMYDNNLSNLEIVTNSENLTVCRKRAKILQLLVSSTNSMELEIKDIMIEHKLNADKGITI